MDLRSLLSIAIALGLGISAAACAGPEAGIVSFTEAGFTAVDDDEDEDEGTTKTKSQSSKSSASTFFANEVYPSLKTACAVCHEEGNTMNAPAFFGKDASSTYKMFKEMGYDRPNSELVTKGAHSGPALTDEQKALIDEWVDAEAGK